MVIQGKGKVSRRDLIPRGRHQREAHSKTRVEERIARRSMGTKRRYSRTMVTPRPLSGMPSYSRISTQSSPSDLLGKFPPHRPCITHPHPCYLHFLSLRPQSTHTPSQLPLLSVAISLPFLVITLLGYVKSIHMFLRYRI